MTTTELSPGTWAALAAEYLNHHATYEAATQARANARLLADMLTHGSNAVHGGNVHQVEYLEPDVLNYRGHNWMAVPNPEPYPDLFAMSQAYYDIDGPVLVSDCYHDHPVWSRLDNLRFRVWHDTGHIAMNLDFSPAGELELFRVQARKLRALPGGEALVSALFSESVYQLAACVHLGGFPDEQYVRIPGPVGRALLDAWGLS